MTMLLSLSETLENFLSNDVVQFILNFLSFIPKIMYFLVACLISFIDFFQITFRKIAGLDPYILSGNVVTGDTVYNVITESIFGNKYPALNTTFWALIILGVFMLIVCTILAVIRIEYKPEKEKGNSKSNIVKNFFVALASFAIIPIASFFVMFLSNELVAVVDNMVTNTHTTAQVDAYTYFDKWTVNNVDNDTLYYNDSGGQTKELLNSNAKESYICFEIFGLKIPTNAEPFSSLVFKASAYSCNRLRVHGQEYMDQLLNTEANFGIFKSGQVSSASPEEVATIIDTGFAINANMKGDSYNLKSVIDSAVKDRTISADYFRKGTFPVHWGAENNNTAVTHFSKYNVELVWFFYDLWTFNYIVAFTALFLLGKFYFQYTLVLMSRFFEIITLLLFAPIAVSTMPLDASVSDRWRKNYITRYGFLLFMVFTLDIVSPLLSIVQNIALFNVPLLDYIISALFIIAGLNVVSTLTSTIAKIIGDKDAADAFKDSLSGADAIQNAAQRGVGATGSAFRVATLPMKVTGHAAAWGVGKGIQGVRKERERSLIKHQIKDTGAVPLDSKGRLDLRSATDAQLNSLFAKTKGAAGLKPGSPEYAQAEARFRAMARAGNDTTAQNYRNRRRVESELVGGGIIGDPTINKYAKKQGNMQNTNAQVSRYRDNALTAMGKARERYSPWVNRLGQDLGNLAGGLPFVGGLFPKPKK